MYALSATVSFDRRGDIALISVDNPPVNALSASVIEGLGLALDALESESGCPLAVLYCAGAGFIAGADLKEVSTVERSNAAAGVINRLAHSGKPVLAAIHGNALGGGLETAMACDYRCGTDDSRFGLPEVNIGAVPGYGGTQRLPRLVGLEPALRMMTTGISIDAQQAVVAGLIDRIIQGNMLEQALVYAHELIDSGAPLRKTDWMAVRGAAQAEELCAAALTEAEAKRPGEEAPALIVRCARMCAMTPIHEGLEYERTVSRSRMGADQCLAMRSLFFAERQVRKFPQRAVAAKDAGIRMLESMLAVIKDPGGEGLHAGRVRMAFRDFGWDLAVLDLPTHASSTESGSKLPPEEALDFMHSCLAALEEMGSQALARTPDLQPGDIDSEFCRAWAFPRFRGGPMYFVQHDRGYTSFRAKGLAAVNADHLTNEVRR